MGGVCFGAGLASVKETLIGFAFYLRSLIRVEGIFGRVIERGCEWVGLV